MSIVEGTCRTRKSVESYAHKAAKQVVVGWLRDIAESTYNDPLKDYTPRDVGLGLHWRINRGAPHYGVWEEYPILEDETGINPVWDEWNYEPPVWDGRSYVLQSPYSKAPPTYEGLIQLGYVPKVILDVGVQHKGTLVAGVEIVHKNPPAPPKIEFLRGKLSALLVLPASWVLSQIGTPNGCPKEFWMWREYF